LKFTRDYFNFRRVNHEYSGKGRWTIEENFESDELISKEAHSKDPEPVAVTMSSLILLKTEAILK